MAARIAQSDGGSFLVVGYRGVGKTSLVNAIVDSVESRIRSGQDGNEPALLINLSFAFTRSMPAVNLLHQMINAIRLELIRRHLFKRIAPDIRRELDLAVLRTVANLVRKDEAQKIMTFGLTVNSPPYATKLELGSSRLSRDILEASFLPYEQYAAEQDVIRLARALAATKSITPSYAQRLRHIFKSNRNPQKIRLMLVFDELDKLGQSGDDDGVIAFNETLKDLKSLLTTSGITFLFVAGRVIYDAWIEDVGKGDSIYESIFSHTEYVPAIWNIADRLCGELLGPPPETGRLGDYVADFKGYLTYHGRGIPRRTLRVFQAFVQIDTNGQAVLAFNESDLRSFRCVAELEDHIKETEESVLKLRGGRREPDRSDNDGLALRYLADWIIECGQKPFGIVELTDACRQLSRMVAPRNDASGVIPQELIRVLENAGFLEIVFGTKGLERLVVDADLSIKNWRVPIRRLIELGRELTGPESNDSEERTIVDRYIITRMITPESTGKLYEAIDMITQHRVVLKYLKSSFAGDQALARFINQNEVTVMGRLNHSGIPRLLASHLDHEPPYLVMQLAEGAPLDSLLYDLKKLDWLVVVQLTKAILAILDYMHSSGIIWGDVKPSNILVSANGEIHLLDFGASRFIDKDCDQLDIPIIGTPPFMAPECLRGKRPSVVSDIYAVGVLLYQMTIGVLPFKGITVDDLLYEISNTALISPMNVASMPAELNLVIMRCLEHDPIRRFSTVKELVYALPEGASDQALREIRDMVSSRTLVRHTVIPSTIGVIFQEDYPSTDPVGGAALPSGDEREFSGRAPPMRREIFRPSSGMPTNETPAPPSPVAKGEAGWAPYDPLQERDIVYLNAVDVEDERELSLDTIEPLRKQYILVKSISAQIGRSKDNEIRIADDMVSRYHARFEFRGNAWFIHALNSLNNTFVNEMPVLKDCQISPGTIIRIGETRIRINVAI